MAQITREELYDLVWTEPTKKVAERFGMSDVGLAKACRRHRIPRPSRGYWAKVRHAKRVRRKPLPELADDESRLATVHISGDPSIQQDDLLEQQKQYELDPEHRIVVPNELAHPHRLLQARKGRKQTLRGILHKRLCQKCYKRGLRIADTLLKALDERGFETELAPEDVRDSVFIVHVHGQPLAVNISEQMDRIEKKRRRKRLFYYRTADIFESEYETYDESVCSGRLRLSIVDSDARHVRKNWNETDKRSLESQPNKFIIGLVAASRSKDAVLRERAEWRRQWEEKRRQMEEERRREEEERRRIAQLEEWAESWERTQRIRRFLDTARIKVADKGEAEAWLSWAEDYIARLDPLAGAFNPTYAQEMGNDPVTSASRQAWRYW